MANLDEIPRGQLSTIILTCLSEQDKYGYEIIDEVLKKTNGRMSIKQPSLYSSLKRMEEQSLISSYWRESDIGGRRHYYHLTDLGKKHLEKWQDSLPENFLSGNSNVEQTKVLQQENLFNLANTNEADKPTTIIEEKPKDASFVQFDLFSNSIIITPPTNEELTEVTNSQEHTECETLFEQKPIITEYVNQSQNQNTSIYHTFNFVKKSNKSFADKIKTINSIEEKKYKEKDITIDSLSLEQLNTVSNIEEKSLTNTQPELIEITEHKTLEPINTYSEEIPEVTQTQYTENINKKDFNSKYNDESNNYINLEKSIETEHPKINLSELKGYLPQTQELETQETIEPEEIKDDAVLITERLNPEDMPKPYKWDSHRFEVYMSDSSIMPNIVKKDNENYEDRVKELYEKSKNTADNQKIELVDSMIKFSNYKDLQDFYNNQNIKFKPYHKKLKKTDRDYDMIKINKFNMLSSLILFGTMSIISIILGIVFSFVKDAVLNHPITFVVFPIILLIIFTYYFSVYLKSPQKRIAYDFNLYKLNINISIVSILLIPIIFAINLIAGFSFSELNVYAITFFYPCIFALTYFIYNFIQRLLLKSKHVY